MRHLPDSVKPASYYRSMTSHFTGTAMRPVISFFLVKMHNESLEKH
jgi:hypothetical protein